MSENALVGFGEALIDLVANDSVNYQAFVGGAPANVAAAVSKLGGQSYFVGSIGKDIFGDKIITELADNGVITEYLYQLKGLPTAAAYVELDADGERAFSFSRHDTADLQFPVDKVPVDLFASEQGVFHFGSNTLTTDYMSAITLSLISLAKHNGWTVSYDVNLRENLWSNCAVDFARVKAFMNMSDVVKMSIEEVEAMNLDQASFLNQSDRVYVITSGSGVIKLYAKNEVISHTPEKVKAIDTTGAGDAFFGGFLFSMCHNKLFDCHANDFQEAIEFAAKCGAYSVQAKGAISSYPKFDQIN